MRPLVDIGVAKPSPNRHSLELKDLTCVVTGASSGIGRAIAAALASAGARVCAVARRRDQLEATAELAKSHGRITPYAADLSVEGEVATLADELRRRAGGVNVLVHSAGTISLGPLGTAPIEDFDRQYAANVRAPYLLTQALLPTLRANSGQIVFINSSVVFAPRANVAQFAATQHALRAIADTLREEVNPDGIRVASIYPGRTATTRQARIHELEGKPYSPERLLQPEDVADTVLNVLTLPRSAEVLDVRIRPMLKH
jgi:NADP-dependent 3-hydroxy acid dehydrogenase YdfG